MSRPRSQSEGELYHITTRGVGKQIIFESTSDRRKYMSLLAQFSTSEDIKIYAWCLMDNHVHLLLHGLIKNISNFMQKVSSTYARYFNSKYQHTGHCFQGRFYSGAISSDAQLIATIRYIHLNPSDLVKDPLNYRWSSYQTYLNPLYQERFSLIIDIFDGLENFKHIHTTSTEDELEKHGFLLSDAAKSACESATYTLEEFNPENKVSDVLLAQVHKKLPNVVLGDVKAMQKEKRDSCLMELEGLGLSYRQIERLTGIGRGTIYRALH